MMRRFGPLAVALLILGGPAASAQETIELCEEAGTLTRNTDSSFYYSSDLRYGADLDELTVWMNRLNDALKAQGDLLVVVPTPLRGMVNGEVVNDTASLEALEIDFDPAAASAYYGSYVASLEPVFAVDLLDAARSLNGQTPGYHFKLDRHWTPEGARASAQAVAQVLATKPAYSALPFPEPQTFTTSPVGTQAAPNKIFELIEENCGDLPDELMETMTLYETEQLVDESLFATDVPPIVLVGSSFSGEQYNFAGFLSEALGQEVTNYSVSGGGLFTSLEDYLLNRPNPAAPSVIIWEYRMTDATGTNSKENFVPFRGLIPATYGACSADTSLASNRVDVSEGTLTLFADLSDARVQGPDYYLHLLASDLSLVEFDITMTHSDGSVDHAAMERSTRIRNTGEFFLELSRDVAAPLREVSLTVPAGTSGTVEAQLCSASR